MRMGPIMEPRPVFTVRIQVESGAVLSGGVRCANASHLPAQLYIGLLKLQASLLELVVEGTQLCNGVGDSNFQLSNPSWCREVANDIDGVALLKTNKRGQQNFFSDVGQFWDGHQHPIHARTHLLELHLHLPSLSKLRPERGQLAISELCADLSHPSNHEVEAGLLVQCLELLLRPALSGLDRVLVEVAPPRLDRLRSDAVDLGGCKQLQRTRHKSLAASGRFLFGEERSRRKFSSRDHRIRNCCMLGGEILIVILWPRANIGARDRFIQRDKIRIISDLVSTVSSLGFFLFLLHDRLQSTRIILSNFYLGINLLDIRSLLSRLPHELKPVQMLQFGCQMERQLMRISRHLLNLSVIISNLGGGCQLLAKVSLNERHRGVLVHSRSALVVLKP